MSDVLITDVRDGRIVDLLAGLGATRHVARQIAGNLVRDYLAEGSAQPDGLADLTDEHRATTLELAVLLTRLACAAGRASCPDLGVAADHAAAAVRVACGYAVRCAT
ncbi:hypothetical protein [Verrucosispora sp. WMMC514]|uniref:hypothetical protein n=1 Tax=Verrucosispora sp. WMMC514 TaxID=3015156 RepID=UPI00248B79F6|nr:hypothetical protein [Verrucosispora sp. WMMC514]WBB94139.1 hypothetical protein O7597_14920 [Verrucosispora sp. WMMC514]